MSRPRLSLLVTLLLALLALAACSSAPASDPSMPPRRARSGAATREPPAPSRPRGDVPPLPPSVHPSPARLVAIGDVHGDLAAFRAALRAGGAVDASDHWIGGALWVVQVGDLLDRGDDEDEILALVARLERDAADAGGRFVALNGNHEVMNAQGDFRYVTRDGFADFAAHARDAPPRAGRARLPPEVQGRAAAFAPGGELARVFASRSTVVVIGGTVFVHGGLVADHAARGLDVVNEAMRAFFLGEAPLPPFLAGEESPVWHREFALSDDPATCARLAETLAELGATRMVVGHTVQRGGITSACDERVFRIDVGLARHYGGPIEALEIEGDTTRVLHGAR